MHDDKGFGRKRRSISFIFGQNIRLPTLLFSGCRFAFCLVSFHSTTFHLFQQLVAIKEDLSRQEKSVRLKKSNFTPHNTFYLRRDV